MHAENNDEEVTASQHAYVLQTFLYVKRRRFITLIVRTTTTRKTDDDDDDDDDNDDDDDDIISLTKKIDTQINVLLSLI